MKCVPHAVLVFALALAALTVTGQMSNDDETGADAPVFSVAVPGLPETAILRAIAKHQIAGEVAARRCPLMEAAALFGELDRLTPTVAYTNRRWHSSGRAYMPSEILCAEVIDHVRVCLQDDPTAAAEALSRMACEFAEQICKDNELRLPDPSTLTPIPELIERARAANTGLLRKSDVAPPKQTAGADQNLRLGPNDGR